LSSSTLTNGGIGLIDPVPIYIFFSVAVPTSRGGCAWLYFSILALHFVFLSPIISSWVPQILLPISS
jgi:hypothetical protein